MRIPLVSLGLDCEKKELKDCPFCGSDPEMKWSIVENLGHCFYVICPNKSCPCNDIWTNFRIVDKKIAIDLWNTRTADNEKSVLVIDEEKMANAVWSAEVEWNNHSRNANYQQHTIRKDHGEFIAEHLSQNAKSFMKICPADEKGK